MKEIDPNGAIARFRVGESEGKGLNLFQRLKIEFFGEKQTEVIDSKVKLKNLNPCQK